MKSKIELNKDVKERIISEIKRYFSEERNENIGDLAATLFLDFLIEHVGPAFYNQGVRDSISYMSDKVDDLYGLEK